MSFFEDIRSEDIDLFNYVNAQVVAVSKELDNIKNVFNEFTDHSSEHAKSVLEIGEKLNTSELNKFEKALFILSAYFHDIGMNVSQERIDQYIESLNDNLNLDFYLKDIVVSQDLAKTNMTEKKRFLALDHYRENHNLLSADYIITKYPKDQEESYIGKNYLWSHVAHICKSHTVSFNELEYDFSNPGCAFLENFEEVNILYLCLLLRLADICHFSRDRAYPFLFKNKIFKSGRSKEIWKFYSDVVITIPDKKTKTIKIQALCENVINHRAIINNSKNIQDELINCHRILTQANSKDQLPWKFVDVTNVKPAPSANYIFNDIKFNLQQNKIIDLLMGEKLYSNKLYAIRECVQNAGDSIHVISTKVKDGHYIYLNYLSDPNPVLEIYDTGTGMNLEILKNNFLSVGSNSYWYSKEGIEEWNIEYRSLDIIADHGIGTLSYFMIGDTLEIFTLYQKTSDFLHVKIDDIKDSILIQKTGLKNFPKFSSTLDLSSPWDLRHGTCIRFKLNFKMNFKDLIQFLSSNILRIPTRLILNFNSAEYQLPQIWHFRKFEDDNVYSEKRFLVDPSNSSKPESKDSDYYKNMYFEERSIYDDHPPNDKAVHENFINLPFIKGSVNINFWDETSTECRISQRGIMIKRAIDFINTNMKSKLLVSAFGFDIDVHGDFAFQLDAERTSIINSVYNKEIFLRLEEILVNKYFNQISQIESSIYFRCGGEFYHGITDVIFSHDDALKCFNSNFKRIFSEEIYKKYIKKVNAFDSAKLYMKGVMRCIPVSVKDLMGLRDIMLIIFKPNNLSEKGISRKIRGRTYIQQDKFEKRIGVKLSDDFIYLTDQNSPFILPLYENFDFIKEGENNFIFLFRLQIGKISDSIRKELNSLWTEE